MKSINGLTVAARNAGMKAGGYMPVGMIRWSIGHSHVSRSILDIAREYWHKRAKAYARPLKRAAVRVAIREHLRNRDLYRSVMHGRCW